MGARLPSSDASRARLVVVLAWTALVLAPDLEARGARIAHAGALSLALYVLSALVGLFVVIAIVRLLGATRARSPRSALGLTLGVAAALALSVPLEIGYVELFKADMPPSAFAFAIANPGYSWALLRQSVGPRDAAKILVSFVVWVPALLYAMRRARSLAPVHLAWAAAPVAVAALLVACDASDPLAPDVHAARVVSRGFLGWLDARKLVHTDQRLPIPRASLEGAPLDVVLIVHESLGAEQLAPWNAASTLAPELASFFARHADDLVALRRAKAVSNATDVALPTMLTGLAPDAKGELFFRAPLAWQEADALGYKTALASSQFFDWANFHALFLDKNAPDIVRVAESFQGALESNDHGVDDRLAVDQALELLRGPKDQPLFIVLQFNSTHWPCWAPGLRPASELYAGTNVVAPSVRSLEHARCDPAASYVARLATEVLEALEQTGRLERTLVVGTSDHGESFRRDRPSRIESFYDDVLTVPLFVHVPPALSKARPETIAALRANAERLASNLDIYPTILDAWGRFPPSADLPRPALGGRSLLREVPVDRAVYSVNTFELRSWSREGFAVFHGAFKWIVEEATGTHLFDLAADPGESDDLAARAPEPEAAFFRDLLAQHPHLARVACKAKSPFCASP